MVWQIEKGCAGPSSMASQRGCSFVLLLSLQMGLPPNILVDFQLSNNLTFVKCSRPDMTGEANLLLTLPLKSHLFDLYG